MLSSVTLDDATGNPVTLHETAKRALTHAGGLLGAGPLRDSKRVRPTAHGAINETRYEDGRTINLEGEVISLVSVADAIAEFRIVTAPMIQTLDVGPALMKWTEGMAGLSLQRLVKLDGPVDPPLDEGAAILNYQAQFFAEDPRAYSQTLTTSTGAVLSAASGGRVFPMEYPVRYTPSGGGIVTFVNAGNRPTPPVFRFYGYAVNPQILLVDTGERHVFNGTIGAGDYLEVGTDGDGARYVRLNGTTSRVNLRDPTVSTWFDLPVGTSTVQAIATAFDPVARVDVLGRSAYA